MSSASGMHNLATIIKRLEAATSRLEDVALASLHSSPFSGQRSTQAAQEGAALHLSNGAGGAAATSAAAAPPQAASSIGAAEPAVDEAPFVKAYRQDIIEGALAEYLAKSRDAAPLVEKHAQLVSTLASKQLDFLTMASRCSKPSTQEALLPLLASTQEALQSVVSFKDSESRTKEGRAWGNHLTAVGEGASAWGWVAVEPTPAPFVGDMKEGAQFYTNRVIKEFKDKDEKQVAWSKSYVGLLDALAKYVKQWHTTGVAWNPKGGDAASYQGGAGSSGVAAAGGAPPPPPPPPPPAAEQEATPTARSAPAAGPGAFLAQLNQGEGVTAGLKKVDPSQQTHKNPSLRGGSVVQEKPSRPAKPTKLQSQTTTTTTTKKPAKTELDGTKWVVEYHEGNNAIVIDQTEINQTVQVFGCKNSVIQVKGKVNAINVVACHKTSILFESVVSQLSITSSPSFTVQVLGMAPTILVDTTDSGQIYLSKECLETVEIITSKTSALNISVPSDKEEGDFVEKPVPEQMKTVVKGGKLVTTIVEHAG